MRREVSGKLLVFLSKTCTERENILNIKPGGGGKKEKKEKALECQFLGSNSAMLRHRVTHIISDHTETNEEDHDNYTKSCFCHTHESHTYISKGKRKWYIFLLELSLTPHSAQKAPALSAQWLEGTF